MERRIELTNLLRSSNSGKSLNEIKMIQREIKKLEKGTGRVDFNQQIQQQTEYYISGRDNRNESIDFIIVSFQEDQEVVRRVICSDADYITSIDSDYQMLLGSSTPTDMTIQHVTLNNSTSAMKLTVLVTGQQKIQDWIMSVLPVLDVNSYFPKGPPFPIFDALSEPIC